MARLDGKVALIAGAGPGIGRACAAALGAAGADLVVAARNLDRLGVMARELTVETGRVVAPHHLDVALLGCTCGKVAPSWCPMMVHDRANIGQVA